MEFSKLNGLEQHRAVAGLDLFFDHETAAATYGIGSPLASTWDRRLLRPIEVSTIDGEQAEFWNIISHPPGDLKVIHTRRGVIENLLKFPEKTGELLEQRAAFSGLESILKALRDVPEKEYHAAFNEGRPARSSIKVAIEELGVVPENLQAKATGIRFDFESRHMEPGDVEKAVLCLAEFDKTLRDALQLEKSLQIFPDDHVQQFSTPLSPQLRALPRITAAEILNAYADDKRDPVYAFGTSLQEVRTTVNKIGAVLSAARIAGQQGFCRADFDLSKPEYFRDGWNALYEKTSGWYKESQVLNDSVAQHQLSVLCGSNMSGKSFYLQQTLFMQLWAQGFGYAPAAQGNFHVYDSLVFLERAGTDTKGKLSAFGTDVRKWKEALETLGERGLVLVDEVFSTTSAEDQYRLCMGLRRGLAGRGARTVMVTHNEKAASELSRLPDCGLYHFDVSFSADGAVTFNHKLTEGIDGSHSLEVARVLGLPKSVIETARDFLRGKRAGVTSIAFRTPEIRRFSRHEREKLKKLPASPRQVFGLGDEIVVERSWDRPYLAWKHRKGEACNQYFEIEPDEDWGEYVPPGCVRSNDKDLREQEKGAVFAEPNCYQHEFLVTLLRQGGVGDASQILERQCFFEELAKDNRFERMQGLLRRVSRYLWGISSCGRVEELFNAPYHLLRKAIYSGAYGIFRGEDLGKITDNRLFVEAAVRATLAMVGGRVESPDIEGFNAARARFGQLVTELGPQIAELYQKQQLQDTAQERDMLQRVNQAYDEFGIKRDPDISLYLSSSLDLLERRIAHKYLGKFCDSIESISFWDLEPERIREAAAILEPFLSRDDLINDASDIAGRIANLGSVKDPVRELLQEMRGCDSVYMHQLANYLSGIIRIYKGRIGSGFEVYEKLRKHRPQDDSQWRRIVKLDPQLRYMVASELYKLETLYPVARGIAEGKLCRVEFNDTGEIAIEEGYNPNLAAEGQIRNSTFFDRANRIELLSGTNMSGKTFDLKKDILCLLSAHAFGFAPATRMTTPILSGIHYLDRVTTFLDNDLSSFGNEIQYWKELLKSVPGRPIIGAVDEAFSTASPRYQEALSYAVVKEVLKSGNILMLSSHAHKFIDAFLADNPAWASVFHFDSRIAQNGDLDFLHVKKPGHAPSQALLVARKLGLPKDIVDFAELF